jgi:uncharacterized protein (TIGR02300 family)
VAKPEWGAKRECRSCGARFYDLHRDTIVCPKCGTIHEIEVPKPRAQAPKEVKEPVRPPPPPVAAAQPEAAAAEGEEALGAADDEEEEEFIEDAAELAEEDVALEIDGEIEDTKREPT